MFGWGAGPRAEPRMPELTANSFYSGLRMSVSVLARQSAEPLNQPRSGDRQ